MLSEDLTRSIAGVIPIAAQTSEDGKLTRITLRDALAKVGHHAG